MSSVPYILQVSELAKKVRFMLESEINTVWLTGEISNFIAASSGHWYLSIKDSQSQLKCAMFKGNNRYVRLKPQNGQQVLIKAKVTLYEPRGDFQLVIEQMEDAGEGLLRQQFELLKNKLNSEGLFDFSYKKPLPKTINTVGVVTSPTGAALKDIIAVLARRNPQIKIIIYPALVQGELAKSDITKAINIANQRNECDVLIVGRGGGSLEDLWAFNEEMVVRAIFASQLPIISAVGHEIDTTLSDYVADIRAATPSAAAELVSQDTSEILNKLTYLRQRLSNAVKQKQANFAYLYKHLKQQLLTLHPEHQLRVQQQKNDDLNFRLQLAMQSRLKQAKQQKQIQANRLAAISPSKKIKQEQQYLTSLEQRLTYQIKQALPKRQQKFKYLIEQLQLVSPLATIARGYSIVKDENNKIIRKTTDVTEGQKLTLQVQDGEIKVQVN